MTRGFDDRKDWAAKMHRSWLEPAMSEYWGVDPDAVQPMTAGSDGAMAADRDGVIDAIVQTAGAAPVFSQSAFGRCANTTGASTARTSHCARKRRRAMIQSSSGCWMPTGRGAICPASTCSGSGGRRRARAV